MSKNYSSQSYSPGSARPAKSTAGDTASKNKEKDEMVGLNDKFVKLIDKVKNLEDENAKLETKLKILKEYEVYKGQVDDIVKQEENELEQKVDNLLHDQEKLQVELDKNIEDKERTKQSYENELQKKDDLEKDFIIAKKDLDNSHMETVHLSLELEDLVGKLDFLRSGFDEETKELESQIQNKNVILPNNSKRCLDMQDIVENFKFQYAKRASHSRDEAERLYQRKMDAMVNKVAEKEEDVRDVKRNIAELERLIQRLIGELEALRRKEESLDKEINDVRKDSDMNLAKAREGIAQLEDALRLAKQKLAEQIREYQELMNIKLALDIEIATYRKLLEGEEQRINDFMLHSADLHLPTKQHLPEKHHLPPKPEKPQAPEPTKVSPIALTSPDTDAPDVRPVPKKLLIRVLVESGRVVSESSSYTEE